jgi:hypothetical protein
MDKRMGSFGKKANILTDNLGWVVVAAVLLVILIAIAFAGRGVLYEIWSAFVKAFGGA